MAMEIYLIVSRGCHMISWIIVNIASGNGLLGGSKEKLTEPMSTGGKLDSQEHNGIEILIDKFSISEKKNF